MNKPLVSVLMTAYNRERFIKEAIESVLESSYKNFELIIVDDCSEDTTIEIAREYEIKDSRINLYLNSQNLGDYSNRNKASTYAKGEYLMYVDSDDKLYKNGIETCVRIMQQFPASNFGMRIFNNVCEPFEINSKEAILRHFFKNPFLTIGPGGTILKRDFFEKIGRYPVKYGPANDMYFNLKAASSSNMVMIPFDFLYYRRHDGQEINNTYSYLSNNYNYLRDALNELTLGLSDSQIKWLMAKNKRRFFVNLLKYFFSTFNFSKASSACKKANFRYDDMVEAIFQ